MTDREYLVTAVNAQASGVAMLPANWAALSDADRLHHAKELHAELVDCELPAVTAFRRQNQRLFPRPAAPVQAGHQAAPIHPTLDDACPSGPGTELVRILHLDDLNRCGSAADRDQWGASLQAIVNNHGGMAGIISESIARAEARAKAIKVAFLTPGLTVGGAERWVASLCRHFDRSKVNPLYVIVQKSTEIVREARRWIPSDVRILADVRLLQAAMKEVDVLISWGPVELDKLTAGAACQIVDVAHGTLGHWGGADRDGFKVQEVIAREAIAAGAHLAAVNEECLLNYPPEVRDRVTIIPNGAELSRVEPSVSKEEAKAKFGIDPGQKVVAFVGRFAKEKNLQALVDALDFLPGWTLLAAGPKYKLPVRLEGKSVVMPGPVDPPGDLYRAADVLCMPSFHEAHSLVLVEANLAGVPVVSYDYPAMKHLTAKHGPLAWLVEPRCSPQALATEILVANEFQGSPHVEKVRQIAMENYTAAAMTRRMEVFLDRIRKTSPVS